MQASRGRTEALGRKAKLAQSYQELLDEFASTDLKSVGNYAVGRLVGKGSFGKVYLATHKLTNGSKVVLKSAKKDDSNLAREIHHHRQFIHPHIARLYEVIVTENMVWLVLEYCPGNELYNYLLDNGPLPVAKVQKVFAQLVGAVAYVHQQSCVHRDLKLENILFDKNENVKLVDFGFTREYEGKSNYLQTFCGTICYSAPEMLKGEKYAGEKVDVWSLGVILYALLCGELPFDDDDDDVTRRRILSEEPKYPDHLTEDAKSLIKVLLSKRTLIRPALPDILAHPFLADHAAAQQAILKTQQIIPFSTPLEKDTLLRMRSAGVNSDAVVESVLAQRCDALAGWWALLIEKEERKVARREKKRREREAENKSLRRLSAASSRLDRLAPGGKSSGDLQRPRGRSERRSSYFLDLNLTDLPQLLEVGKDLGQDAVSPIGTDAPPPPIDKDSIRSVSSSRHRRPIPPPKEGVIRSARSRGSTLHLVTTGEAIFPQSHSPAQCASPNHLQPPAPQADDGKSRPKVRKKPSQAIIEHWKNWTHWLSQSAKRGRHHNRRGSLSTPNLVDADGNVINGNGGSISSHNGDRKSTKESHSRPQTSKHHITTGAHDDLSSSVHGGRADSDIHSTPRAATNGYHVERGLPVTNGSSSAGDTGAGSGSNPASPAVSTPRGHHASGSMGGTSGLGHHQHNHHHFHHQNSSNSYKRQSLSPSPLTPRSAMRRSSAGLLGRKSTSSSVSSIRSIHHHHHHHSHSKASSTSSNGSVSTSISISKTPSMISASARNHSPHHSSIKVLTATPATSTPLPSNIRLVRAHPGPLNFFGGGSNGGGGGGSSTSGGSMGNSSRSGWGGLPTFNTTPPPLGSPNPFSMSANSGGLLFAKRKRSIFKGPMLGGSGPTSGSGTRSSSGGASSSSSHKRSTSSGGGMGRRSGEMAIQEEDEMMIEEGSDLEEIGDEDEDEEDMTVLMLDPSADANKLTEEDEDEIEEVDVFRPIVGAPGEKVEEQIFEEGEAVPGGKEKK